MLSSGISINAIQQISLAVNATTSDTGTGIEAIGKGGVLGLISQYFGIFLILFLGILLLILIPIIIKYKTRKPSKLDIKLLELQQEREKFQLLSKRMIAEELKDSTMVLTPKEQDSIESLRLDTSILSRKILYKMNEVEERTKRLEIGSAGTQLLATLENIKDQEQKTFRNNF